MRDVSQIWIDYITYTNTKTLVKCLRVELRSGISYGMTTHTRDLLFDGQVYYSSAGLLDTAIARTEGFSTDNLEFTTVLTEDMHVAVEAGKFDGARAYIFLVDFTDLTKGPIDLSTGYVGEMTRDQGIVKAEILGLMSRLNRKTGRVYSTECDAYLGDLRCKVPMLDRIFTVEATVDTDLNVITRTAGDFFIQGFVPGITFSLDGSTAGNNGIYGVNLLSDAETLQVIQPLTGDEETTFTLTILTNRTFTKSVDSVNILSPQRMFDMSDNLDVYGATMEDQWLGFGIVTFLTGDNAGEKRDVASHVGTAIECYLDFPFAIEVGDAFTISVGCDLTAQTCKEKFQNILNHRGFPHSPTQADIFYSPAQIT